MQGGTMRDSDATHCRVHVQRCERVRWVNEVLANALEIGNEAPSTHLTKDFVDAVLRCSLYVVLVLGII